MIIELHVLAICSRNPESITIEVYGKNVLNLPDDTIGLHLAISLGSNVIISDDKANPYSWTLLQPDGQIIGISVDRDKLDNKSIFEYKKIG